MLLCNSTGAPLLDTILDDYEEIYEAPPVIIRRRFTLVPDFARKPLNPAYPREVKSTSAPLQAYLSARFADQSLKGEQYRALQRENQRKHDLAAKNWPSQYT